TATPATAARSCSRFFSTRSRPYSPHCPSLPGHQPEADRGRRLELLAGGEEGARLRVDAEENDAVGVLVADDHPGAGRIDGEVPRALSSGRRVAERLQLAAAGFDAEDRDAVVAAVGAVEEPPRRVDRHLRGVVLPGEAAGERADRLEGAQATGALIVAE